ncbi:MAG: hypothetical protein FWB98_02900, partial [Defluviitaleaceae bacterium]|nr:hypothetical protein [Defluviitaleaceae bacterium]
IKVHFDDVDINGNPALVFDEDLQDYILVNFIDFYSDAEFLLNIAAQFGQVGENQEIDFGGGVIVTVTVQNPPSGTLEIAKTSTVLSAVTDKTMTFTITLTASGGAVHDIILNDFEQPSANGLIRNARFNSITVSVNGGNPYTPPEFASLAGRLFGDGFSLAFDDVTLNPNEQIVVNFTLDIADLINTVGTDQYNFDFWLYNRAQAQGVDAYGTPTATVTADNTAHIMRQLLNKTGAQDTAYDYTVKWSNWSVGDGVTILNGLTITDTLTGLVFGSNNLLPNGENGVYINFIGADGAILGSLYLTVPAGAGGFTFVVPNNLGIITRVTLGQDFWTTVADTSDFDNTNTVTYYNNITINIDGNPSYTVGTAVTKPGRMLTVEKSGVFGSSDGNEIDYVEWTIELYVPKEAYGHPLTIWDDTFVAFYGLDRLYPRDVPQDFEIRVHGTDLIERVLTRNVDFTLLDYDNNNGFTQITNNWYLLFMGSTEGLGWGELDSKSLWAFDEDTWLTMTYKIPLDTMCYDDNRSMTLKEALQKYTNLSNYKYVNSYLMNVNTAAFVGWPISKSAVVSGNTVKYQVIISNNDNFDFSYADIFSDTFDPLFEYVPFSMRVWQGGGVVQYGLYEMVDGVFTDLLSESLAGNSISFDFLNMWLVGWDAGGATYWENPTLLSDNPISDSYYIEYTLKLRDDAPLGGHDVANLASIGGFTNVSEVTIGGEVVEKTMDTNSNLASVSIIINPEGKTLADGAGQYTITDISSDTLAMYLSTISIYAWEGDAWVAHPLTVSPSGDLWTYSTSGANQISFVVPDATMLKITYTALIKGSAGDTVVISNQVTVAGEYFDSAEEAFFIVDTKGSGHGTRSVLTVIKHDADEPDIQLSGAIFALYIGIAYSGWDTVKVPAGIDRVITVGEMNFYYLASGVTASNGQLVFNNQWLTPSHEAIYALKEYQSALGYEMPAEPIRLLSYSAIADVQQISDAISVPNTKTADLHAIIHGSKMIIGEDAPDKIFTFNLTQIDASGADLPEPHTDTTTTLGQGDFGFLLTNITTNTLYYYKITETTDPSDTSWTYDPLSEAGQIVTVFIANDGTTTVTYPDGTDKVTFTNEHKVQPKPIEITLSANKSAIGSPLPAGRFRFALISESGEVISTATNAHSQPLDAL